MDKLRKFQTAFESTKRRTYYLVYTILFLVLVLLCYSYFLFSGRSFIWMTDGWTMHFKAMVYYAQYLRTIFRHIFFDHQLIIPDWDFYIGEGADIIATMHGYAVGDPITLLAVFVPTKFMQYYYSFSHILRLYLAGMAFSELCFGTDVKNSYGVLSGTLAYCFCGRVLAHCVLHPMFINPMITFPLLILGTEKIIRKKKPYLFVATITMSVLINMFFFYISAILTMVYVLIRLFLMYGKRIKESLIAVLKLGGYSLVGVSVSGVLFLPEVYFLLSDGRGSSSRPFSLFYPLSYYSALPGILISEHTDYELYIGLAAPVIVAIFLLFGKRKKNTFLKILFVTAFLFLLLPICGRVLNGMSYAANRWCFGLVLLCAYILSRQWDELITAERKQWSFLLLCSVIYYLVILLFAKSRNAAALSSVPFFFLTLIVICSCTGSRFTETAKSMALIGIVMAGAVNLAYWTLSPEQCVFYSEFVENEKTWDEWENNEARVIKALANTAYPRYTGSSLIENANVINGISNTQYYWSVSNPYMNSYRKSLSMRELIPYSYEGYDDRTTPIALSGSLYYAAMNGASSYALPYGFELVDIVNTNVTGEKGLEEMKRELGTDTLSDEQIDRVLNASTLEYTLYRNNYPLPMGYCYSAYITKDIWDALNPAQKQETLLKAAYVDGSFEDIPLYLKEIPDYKVPYEIEYNGTAITPSASGIVTTSDKATATIRLSKEVTDSEIYVGINGLTFDPTQKYDLYFGSDEIDPLKLYNRTNWKMLSKAQQASIRREKRYARTKMETSDIGVNDNYVRKNIGYLQPESNYSDGRHDFIANLGYREEPIDDITITFDEQGVYSFDELCVYAIPFAGYTQKISNLAADTLQDLKLDTNTLTGNIELDSPKLLCVAVPYSPGWKAYVDEARSEVLCINEHYIGLYLPEGTHTIRFCYATPYKKEGALLSLIGLFALITIILFERKSHSVCTDLNKAAN